VAISPDSSKTESITVRVPKELIEKARSIVGGGNTKAVLAGLRLLCGESSPIPDAVPNTVLQEITERITALESAVSNTVLQEITERITALESTVSNTVLQEITERITALESTVSNTVLQEITERITVIEAEIHSLKGALPRSELSGSVDNREPGPPKGAGEVYDRESLEKIKVHQLRKLYTALIPFQARSIVPNKVTKSQAIEAILDYQNKRQAEKDDR
jgi:hypothetical protein